LRHILKIIGFFLSIINFLFAISFAKTYGGVFNEGASFIHQTNDGGYIVAGTTNSFGGGNNDFLVIKLNPTGNIQWVKTFGGWYNDDVSYLQPTNDGGYIIVGKTNSFGTGDSDVLVIKLNSQGNIEWSKTFGGDSSEGTSFIKSTIDGGYIIVGSTHSFDAGYSDIIVIKLNSQGDIEWSKIFGRNGWDAACSIQQTNDGGYILGGRTEAFGIGYWDFLIIKLTPTGDIQWSKIFGGEYYDLTSFIYQTNDGGYIAGGSTESFGVGGFDILVMKLNSVGNIEWAKTFGTVKDDYGFSFQKTQDGGYVIAGATGSWNEGFDFLVIKLDSTGIIQWSKTFGGGDWDVASSISQTNDGGYIVAGSTSSFGAGGDDFLVIKTQDGQMSSDCPWYNYNLTITSPNVFVIPASIFVIFPQLNITFPSPSTSVPLISVSDICNPVVEENIYFSEKILKLESSIFLKNKIFLKFSGYSKEEIKLILYDISGKEIFSKSFGFNNYIKIKDERIEKIKRGVYFLKIYLKGKKIGSLKVIKE
jgi:uncharacterized delta-60 repeat protein